MLARENRLRKAADITHVYKLGSYGASGGVLSVKAAHSGRSRSRAVVVVGKKVSKRAVVRNRLRRRFIGDLERSWATLKTGYDIVISVHRDVSEMPAGELSDHLSRALTRAGVK
ncbi:MAG TPA: ribonuclease P protein component [Candidatus Saccharimonadia bacterium]|jgi:ribonuclease P protein component